MTTGKGEAMRIQDFMLGRHDTTKGDEQRHKVLELLGEHEEVVVLDYDGQGGVGVARRDPGSPNGYRVEPAEGDESQ